MAKFIPTDTVGLSTIHGRYPNRCSTAVVSLRRTCPSGRAGGLQHSGGAFKIFQLLQLASFLPQLLCEIESDQFNTFTVQPSSQV